MGPPTLCHSCFSKTTCGRQIDWAVCTRYIGTTGSLYSGVPWAEWGWVGGWGGGVLLRLLLLAGEIG